MRCPWPYSNTGLPSSYAAALLSYAAAAYLRHFFDGGPTPERRQRAKLILRALRCAPRERLGRAPRAFGRSFRPHRPMPLIPFLMVVNLCDLTPAGGPARGDGAVPRNSTWPQRALSRFGAPEPRSDFQAINLGDFPGVSICPCPGRFDLRAFFVLNCACFVTGADRSFFY